MTTVMWGTNTFVNCDTLLGIADHPVLRVLANPVRVTLRTPAMAQIAVDIVDNTSQSQNDELRIVAAENSVSVFWSERHMVYATALGRDAVHLHVDLRPIGINVYDDPSGLHIGNNTLAANMIVGLPMAIGLK